jgi:hypothetical protein
MPVACPLTPHTLHISKQQLWLLMLKKTPNETCGSKKGMLCVDCGCWQARIYARATGAWAQGGKFPGAAY